MNSSTAYARRMSKSSSMASWMARPSTTAVMSSATPSSASCSHVERLVFGSQPALLDLPVRVVGASHAVAEPRVAQRVGQHVEEDAERAGRADRTQAVDEPGQAVLAADGAHGRRGILLVVAEDRVDHRLDEALLVPEVVLHHRRVLTRLRPRWCAGEAGEAFGHEHLLGGGEDLEGGRRHALPRVAAQRRRPRPCAASSRRRQPACAVAFVSDL